MRFIQYRNWKWQMLICLMNLFIVPVTFAQPVEIDFEMEPFALNSGKHNGAAIERLAFSTIVQIEDAGWLRLFFSDANLGSNSYLKIISLEDNAMQRLNALSLTQWYETSAYFNGGAVKIELYVGAGDTDVFIEMAEVMAGPPAVSPVAAETQCGPTDDRVASNHLATGRLLNGGCTGWIIVNGLHATAGHCVSSNTVLQFQVPESTSGGGLRHPGPEDQYSVNTGSYVFANGGVGNDWATFKIFNNSNTGLQPIEAQGAAFSVVQDYGPSNIRITGYGVDIGSANQTQQTHVGPNAGSASNVMRYRADTEGGNSGGPVIDEATGLAVGIHTHGGCGVSGGNNNGTSTFHSALWTALNANGPPAGLITQSIQNFEGYSDYNTPDEMALTWKNPRFYVGGDTIMPGAYTVVLERDDVQLAVFSDSVESYLDTGLTDGQRYTYKVYTVADSSGLNSPRKAFTWAAGGAQEPNLATNFSLSGDLEQIEVRWQNPSQNIDGTPMDDFAGINLYRDSVLVHTFTRSAADTGKADSASYIPNPGGYSLWYIAAVDNETPVNESETSGSFQTPLSLPFADHLTIPGEPFWAFWENFQVEVDDRAIDAPSGPYTLNLNGHRQGRDLLTLKSISTANMENSGLVLAYQYQPQGSGAAPGPNDSLRLFLKNDLDEWILTRAYGGTDVMPFVDVRLGLDTLNSGSGTFFHDDFQFQFGVKGNLHPFQPVDDWFVDNIFFGHPRAIADISHDSLDFQNAIVSTPEVLSIEVQNTGLENYDVTEVISTNSAFTAAQTAFAVNSSSHLDLEVEFDPPSTDFQEGWIHIVHNAPNNDTLSVYVSGQPALVGIETPGGLPRQFAISRNYPNPFNPTTQVQYQLPANSKVQLVIYNTLGQAVRTLVDGSKNAGYHVAEWDGRDEAGAPVASGIYIYRFTADGSGKGFVKSQKMILLK